MNELKDLLGEMGLTTFGAHCSCRAGSPAVTFQSQNVIRTSEKIARPGTVNLHTSGISWAIVSCINNALAPSLWDSVANFWNPFSPR